ncbi:MAG: hypothetical protein H0W48_00405 [Methylibium sp.]|nr:hypothetical protein [Methylibium sp.]
MCGGGGGADKNTGKAALETAALSREQLEWFKQEYAATADERAAATNRANEVGEVQLDTMRQQNTQAAELAEFDKTTFRPIQQRLATEAMNYDTPERRAAEAARAGADVQMASDQQMGVASRNLSRSGVNPGAMQSVALQQQGALETAKMRAGAENQARQGVEAMGYARMSDAANGGQGIAAQQQAATSTALGAGQAAVGSSQAGLGASMSGIGAGNSAYGTSASMMGQAGSLYGQNAQAANQKSASNAQTWGAVGSVVGMAAVAF